MRARTTIAVFAVLALSAAASAGAETIFSTFGPGDGFSSSNYTPVNFYTDPEVIGTQLAFAFTVPGAASYTLDAVELAASWVGTKKNALFTLYEDAGGVPAETPLVVLAENPAALPRYPVIAIVSLPAPSALVLQAGQRYWFSVAPASLDSSVPADDAVQLWLNPDVPVTETSRNWFGGGPWQPWFSPAFQAEAPAFRVLASAVPVPPVAWLFAAGFGLLAPWVRRSPRGCSG